MCRFRAWTELWTENQPILIWLFGQKKYNMYTGMICMRLRILTTPLPYISIDMNSIVTRIWAADGKIIYSSLSS